LIPQYVKDGAIKKGVYNVTSVIKDIWNVVEDRRIDRFVFDSAPGYRDYYRAMYDKYFNDKLIDKALLSDEHTEENVESYMFRIINLHNKNTDLNALKGLREIYKVIGLGSISRLKSTSDSFEVALKVFQIIMSNLPSAENGEEGGSGNGDQKEENQPQNSEGSGGSGSDEPREMTDEEFEDFSNSMNGSAPAGGGDDTPTGGSGMGVDNLPENMEGGKPSSPSNGGKETEKVKLSDRQKDLLQKKIEKQKKFMDGDVRKKTISKKDNDNLQAIDESGSEMTTVGNIDNGWGTTKSTQCIVVKKLTQSLLESEMFPMTSNNYWNTKEYGVIGKHYEKEVMEGIKIGTILGNKLQPSEAC